MIKTSLICGKFFLNITKNGKAQYIMANRITINKNSKPCYDILITKGFDELKDELTNLSLNNKKYAIITDSQVGPIYADSVKDTIAEIASEVAVFTFKAGEASKNLDTINEIYDFLLENNFTRTDVLIALGGGVVGDMTGFVAATYMRGIDFIQIPTTLLSQVDSSIGGKTGVDYKQYKNIIGAFNMPRLVYTNTDTLNTLDARQYYAGMAEVMKYGLIRRSAFYIWLIDNMYEIHDKDAGALEYMLGQSCQIKKEYVEKDPYDKGDRAILNFGHTIGHAIEKAMNFTLLHGECVALGSIAAAFISWKKGYIQMEDYYEIRDMFVPFNLPISIDNIDAETILENIKYDKKHSGSTLSFISLKKVGKAFIDTTVTKEEITDALNEIIFTEEDAHE